MTKQDAIKAAQAVNPNVNLAERAQSADRGIRVYLLGHTYVTKGGSASAQILGVGSSWEAAIEDLKTPR